MRTLNLIVVHCSATQEGQDLDVNDLKEMHLAKGWSDIGYHYVITLDGKIQAGRPIEKVGAHVRGHNSQSVGICYIGGIKKGGDPNKAADAKDTRTPQQKAALEIIVRSLKTVFPSIKNTVGHRDLSPDINGDGTIQASERLKQCPSFDAIPEYKDC